MGRLLISTFILLSLCARCEAYGALAKCFPDNASPINIIVSNYATKEEASRRALDLAQQTVGTSQAHTCQGDYTFYNTCLAKVLDNAVPQHQYAKNGRTIEEARTAALADCNDPKFWGGKFTPICVVVAQACDQTPVAANSNLQTHSRDITDEPFIGFDIGPLPDDLRATYQRSFSFNLFNTLSMITRVHPGSQAEAAGLRPLGAIYNVACQASLATAYMPPISEILQILQEAADTKRDFCVLDIIPGHETFYLVFPEGIRKGWNTKYLSIAQITWIQNQRTRLTDSRSPPSPLPANPPPDVKRPQPSEDGFTLFLRTYDYQAVIIVCATIALCIFAALQLVPFVRTGKHEHGKIPERLAMAFVCTVLGAGLYFLSMYFVPIAVDTTYHTITGLRTAAQVLLAIVILIAILFALPHRFWMALRPKSIFNALSLGAANSAPNVANPPQPAEASAPPDAPTVEMETAEVPPAQPEPDAVVPPAQGMALKLKRSQKQGVLGGVTYILDARMDVSADIRDYIRKHRLGKRLVYESEARQKRREATQAHLAETKGNSPLFAPADVQLKGAARTFWKLGRAAVSAARTSMALQITVDSLLAGVHVECKTMEELLEAETAIREAAENLKAYVEVGKTFDGGEEVVEL
jgi:hypothetical protein